MATALLATDIGGEIIEAIVDSQANEYGDFDVEKMTTEELENHLKEWFPNEEDFQDLYAEEIDEVEFIKKIDFNGMITPEKYVFNNDFSNETEFFVENLAKMLFTKINDLKEEQQEKTNFQNFSKENNTFENDTSKFSENDDVSSSCSICNATLFLIGLKLLVILLL